MNDAGFPVEVDGLHQVHNPDVRQITRELGASFAPGLEPLALDALERGTNADANLLYIDGLCQVVLYSQFESANLVFD